MQLYTWFIDNSNPTAEVPPPGATFNEQKQNVEINGDENREARLGRVLKPIANDVNKDITIIADNPSKNEKNDSLGYECMDEWG